MANIKISELNELETRHRNDLLPIVNSSNNETEKIKVENLINENVELIAVSPTAPSECSLGDKYFNTTSNKIYTAIATDTWSSTGENAVEGILYVVFGDQSTYAYDGTTLINIGGSSSYSDLGNKPSINGNTLNGNKTNAELGIPNALNEYSTSTTDGYSCGYTNNKITEIENKIPVTESGVIKGNQMTQYTLGSDNYSYYDLTFQNTYTNPPTVVATTWTSNWTGFGIEKTMVANISNTTCKLCLSAYVNTGSYGISYMVISND